MSGQVTTDHAPARARPGLAAGLSALIPGAGQWYGGRPIRAAVVASPMVLLIIASAFALQGGSVGILEWIVRPSVLWGLLTANVLLLLWRLFAVIDAYRLAGSGRTGAWSFVLLAVAVGIVMVPHIVVGAYGVRGTLLIDRVFVSADATNVTPVTLAPPSPEADIVPDPATVETTSTMPPTTTTTTTTTTEAPPGRNMIFRPGIGDPDAIKARPDIVSGGSAAPFLPFEDRVNPGRLTFLLAGGDAGPGRGGLRTDTIMVATIDLESGEAALFGIPRNMGQIPMPKRFETAFADLDRRLAPESDPETWKDVDGDGVPDEPEFVPCNCFPEQINALYPYTRKWTRSFPNEVDPGMAALREVVEHMLGLHIDYYVLVDMQAFVALVDAVDGVDVYVNEALEAEVSPPAEGEEWATVDVEPGMNHLSGTEALAYARARKGSSDYARMTRQRCLLRAVAADADPLTLLRSFPAIADAIESYVVTDVPVVFLPDLVRAAAKLDFSSIATVGFNPPYYAPKRDHTYHPIPDVGRIRFKVKRVLEEGVVAQSKTGVSECDPEL
ncbi:MAG: LCP family protein [Actinomycetota bacterium]|nr:LCP family protein [Actinomycetota bacterium]